MTRRTSLSLGCAGDVAAPPTIRSYLQVVGTNRRYGSDLSQAAIDAASIRPRPVSLTKAEVGDEIREAREPVPVESWVRFHEASILVKDAVAVAWTDRAICIEWTSRDGAKQRTWVWASAVQRR